jgi:hypothetical protein
VRTAVNVSESFFLLGWAVVLLDRVLREAKKCFAFEMCGLKLNGKRLAFYIKPVDGLKLPKIMQWMMNFVHDELRSLSKRSRRGSMCGRRERHVFFLGDFFGFFWIGEPPEWAKEVDWVAVDAEANKEIPAAITYSLSWTAPAWRE